MIMPRKLAIFGLLAAATLSTPAHAAFVTYDYAGAPFTYSSSTSFGNNISGSVTFDGTVTANYTGTVGYKDITSYQFSAGTASVSSPSATLYYYNGSPAYPSFTFSKGAVVAWAFSATNPQGTELTTQSVTIDGYPIAYDQVLNGDDTSLNTDAPGSWSVGSVSAVPLPGALPMFGAALIGMVGLATRTSRRRRTT